MHYNNLQGKSSKCFNYVMTVRKRHLPFKKKFLLFLQLYDVLFNCILYHKSHNPTKQKKIISSIQWPRKYKKGKTHQTGLYCPIRWILSWACCSTAGFHQGSIKKTQKVSRDEPSNIEMCCVLIQQINTSHNSILSWFCECAEKWSQVYQMNQIRGNILGGPHQILTFDATVRLRATAPAFKLISNILQSESSVNLFIAASLAAIDIDPTN